VTVHDSRSKVASFLAYASPLRRRGFGEPYDEQVFQYFLSLERRRAEQAKRPLLLALVSLQVDMEPQRLSPRAGGRIFDGLAHCVREVDFIGWLRQDFVAAAVLVQGDAPEDASARVEERVTRAVYGRLPADLHDSLRVQVKSLSPRARD